MDERLIQISHGTLKIKSGIGTAAEAAADDEVLVLSAGSSMGLHRTSLCIRVLAIAAGAEREREEQLQPTPLTAGGLESKNRAAATTIGLLRLSQKRTAPEREQERLLAEGPLRKRITLIVHKGRERSNILSAAGNKKTLHGLQHVINLVLMFVYLFFSDSVLFSLSLYLSPFKNPLTLSFFPPSLRCNFWSEITNPITVIMLTHWRVQLAIVLSM